MVVEKYISHRSCNCLNYDLFDFYDWNDFLFFATGVKRQTVLNRETPCNFLWRYARGLKMTIDLPMK